MLRSDVINLFFNNSGRFCLENDLYGAKSLFRRLKSDFSSDIYNPDTGTYQLNDRLLASSQIYYHVGLGKVASTYLQYRFFPQLQGINYIQRTRYKRATAVIKKNPGARFLVSREFDQQLERETANFAAHFPTARPIILLRPNHSWIASQYRRMVKNAHPWTFEEFFNLQNDGGAWKRSDLAFFPKIKFLEEQFEHKPLVLFYENLINEPMTFLHQLAQYMGATFDEEQIRLSKKHTSYNEKQLQYMLWLSKRVNVQKNKTMRPKLLRYLRNGCLAPLRYSYLYTSALFPQMPNAKPLILPGQLEAIQQYYKEDWESCRNYAAINNFGLSTPQQQANNAVNPHHEE